MRTLEQKAADLASKIDRQVKKAAGRGLNAARLFIEGRVKETAAVKAPTRTSASGRVYATTPATPGAPLRVVTGRFRGSITSEMVPGSNDMEALVGANARAEASAIRTAWGVVEAAEGFSYAKYWEVENPVHKTFQPTFEQYSAQMSTIIGQEVKIELT